MMQFNKENDRLVCIFPKRVDTVECVNSQDEILKRTADEKDLVIFEMKEVSYVSSSFLRICLQVFKMSGSAKFKLVNVSPEVKKVFKISGLDAQIKIE